MDWDGTCFTTSNFFSLQVQVNPMNTFEYNYPRCALSPLSFPLPEREIKRNRGDATAPIRSPALLGTAIAVDREFFFEIGAFDKGLEFWGGDDAELSLRVSWA